MTMQCPRDSEALERSTLGPAEILVCSECKGLWISRSDLESFLQSPFESWKLPWSQANLANLSALDDTARCLCAEGAPMKTVTRDGVRVDVCPECSAIWFDGGELQELLQNAGVKPDRESDKAWVAAGGVDVLISFLGGLFSSS